MHHPEVFIVTALMLADYYLTMWGAALAEQGYRQHFKTPSYELNPIWRGDVAKKRMFNPRHLVLAAVLTALLIWAGETGDALSPWFFPVMFGMVLGAFVPILCQHVGNIFMFDFLRRHPSEIEGAVTTTMRYAILVSLAYSLPVLAPIAIAAWYTRDPLVIGMLIGAGVLTLARFSWLRRATPPATKA